MNLCDFTAIDKLLDLHNENTIVLYENKKYKLDDLKEFFIDENISISILDHEVNQKGVYYENKPIIIVLDLQNHKKDDLINL